MTKKEVYMVEGMSCAGCERTVQKMLTNLDGVSTAKASFAEATVVLEYDPERVSMDAMKSALAKVHYKLVDQRPPHGQREGSDEAIP